MWSVWDIFDFCLVFHDPVELERWKSLAGHDWQERNSELPWNLKTLKKRFGLDSELKTIELMDHWIAYDRLGAENLFNRNFCIDHLDQKDIRWWETKQ